MGKGNHVLLGNRALGRRNDLTAHRSKVVRVREDPLVPLPTERKGESDGKREKGESDWQVRHTHYIELGTVLGRPHRSDALHAPPLGSGLRRH